MDTNKGKFIIEMVRFLARNIRVVRMLLLITTVASALTFISVYNTRSDGWYTVRKDLHDYIEDLRNQCDTLDALTFYKVIADERGKLERKKSSGACNDICDFQLGVLKWLEEKSPRGTSNYEAYVSKPSKALGEFWQDRRNELIYTIRIPWFGIHFDINDLGLFAGFFLNLFLLMLLYAVSLRYANLHSLFKVIHGIDIVEERQLVYNLATFSMILSLPKKSEVSLIILRFVPYALFCFPSIVYVYLFFSDVATLEFVLGYYPKLILQLLVELLFLVSLIVIIAYIIKFDRATDKLWDDCEELLGVDN